MNRFIRNSLANKYRPEKKPNFPIKIFYLYRAPGVTSLNFYTHHRKTDVYSFCQREASKILFRLYSVNSEFRIALKKFIWPSVRRSICITCVVNILLIAKVKLSSPNLTEILEILTKNTHNRSKNTRPVQPKVRIPLFSKARKMLFYCSLLLQKFPCTSRIISQSRQ